MLRFINALTFSVLILANCFEVHFGYVYYKVTDTERGFCEGPGFGRILVGATGYDDIKCEVLDCREGVLSAAGCGSVAAPPPSSNCTLERGEGHYPACCRHIKCNRFDNA
ncbi:toxin-like protein 14 [Uloborus diversus]|uniref:toxin-like protein 14 n=1 Tax=Uloborus diversus TaxID=327109 RepID=UPI002409DE3C|nr:toxin-like protein 14 [Uloborus diversus]